MSRLFKWYCKLLQENEGTGKIVSMVQELQARPSSDKKTVAKEIAKQYETDFWFSMYGEDHTELWKSPDAPAKTRLLGGIKIAPVEPGTPLLAPATMEVVQVFYPTGGAETNRHVVYRLQTVQSGARFLIVGGMASIGVVEIGHVCQHGELIGHVGNDKSLFPHIHVQLVKEKGIEQFKDASSFQLYFETKEKLEECTVDPTLLVLEYQTVPSCLVL